MTMPVLAHHLSERLSDVVAESIELAGPDYRWEHPLAPSLIDSAHRQGLTAILAEWQEGLCVACGDALAGERYDLCHIVPSRISGRGVRMTNVYIGHTSCNSDDAKQFDNGVVPIASLIRADLLPMILPTRKECVARSVSMREERAIRRANRMATLSL